MIRTVDYSPLTAPVTREQVAAFKTASRGRAGYTSPVAQVVAAVLGFLVLGAVFIGFLVVVASFVFSDRRETSPAAAGVLIFPSIMLAVFVLIAVFAVRAMIRGGGWERWYRLDRFATANGLVFSRQDPDPQYPGTIFSTGRSRLAVEHLRSAADRYLDYGNYRYVTGSGKNSTTHNWGFLALQLDRSLPNMVLDSKANNGLFGGTNLPAVFAKDQVLHLEGDFDQHFTLYCPKQYERDALYVFTPDLMALLIDNAAPFDVEIVDTWMFVYSARPFDLGQPALHQRLLGIVDTIGAKTLSQTDRYRDERVGDVTANIVAPHGRRLRRGVSVGAVVFIAVLLVFWGWPFVADMIGLAGR